MTKGWYPRNFYNVSLMLTESKDWMKQIDLTVFKDFFCTSPISFRDARKVQTTRRI